MASIRKPFITRPVPRNATLFERDGEQFAKWKPRNGGRSQTAKVVHRRDGSLGIRTRATTYTARYRDGNGILKQVSTGCRDKEAAKTKLAELVRLAELVKADVITSDQAEISKHQKTALVTHISDYIDSLKARNVHPDRVKTTEKRLRESASGCRFQRLSDLNHDRLESWMTDTITNEGRSASVYNGYVAIWKAFGNWLAGKRRTGRKYHWNGDKRILENPFSGIGLQDSRNDRRRIARSLTTDELKRLLEATRTRPLTEAMTIRRGKNKGKLLAKVSDSRRKELVRLGEERRLIYMTAALTGLRANELRTLRVSDLSFGDVPFLKLESKNEKNRSGSTVPLRADLAAELKAWVESKVRDELVFRVPAGFLKIMNRDMRAAGIPKVDADGRVAHVHGLRTTFGTHLSAAGVAPRVAQAAMRHSDISLTMNTYTDARLLDTASAVESLPDLGGQPDCPNVGRMVAPTVAPEADFGGQISSIQDN